MPENGTVLLAGGGLGNAVLFSIGKKARQRGTRVVYFAGYKKAEDFYKREELEAAADVLVLSVDRGEAIPARRASDRSFVDNIVEAMLAYAGGQLGEVSIPLSAAQRMIVIGSDRMMAAVARARKGVLAAHLSPDHVGIASINSPMQCMMKEVCPTLKYALSEKARIILASHLGRPKGKPEPEFSLAPVARRLGDLLKKEVPLAPDCIGPEVERMVEALKPGDVLLLENLRFHKEEEKNEPSFAQSLAKLAEVYVNDAIRRLPSRPSLGGGDDPVFQ